MLVGDRCRQQLCVENCGQTAADRETWLLLATYMGLSSLFYLTVLSSTPYRLGTIHALQTDRQMQPCTKGANVITVGQKDEENYNLFLSIYHFMGHT